MADLMGNATMENTTFSSNTTDVDLPKTVSLVFIFIFSLFGNACTIAIVSQFKQHKLPDVLVIGLACTDLVATFIPVPMSLYSYVTLEQFAEGSFACNFYGTIAQFTRYASALIVTLISLERYFAVNQPFIYRNHATPFRCFAVLMCCWILAFALALVPALDSNTPINSHDGFCLFDFSSNYAISIIIYALLQFFIVLVCFVLVTANLLKVYQRRKEWRVQGNYNQNSQAREREREVTFSKPNLTSRISGIGSALKKAAPLITEKFQLGVEAQFARMLFAVVALFYVSWTALVILMAIAQVRQSEGGLSLAMFWGIRLSVISLGLNPLLYGLLARQYRLAYLYALRRVLSWCCSCCVQPPLKNVFATARTPGGDVQSNSRLSVPRRIHERHYGSQSNRSVNGSLCTHTGLPVLTHPTHISLDLLPHLDEEEFLSTVQEESICDHSTYIPSVGELSSTVVIPQQARETYERTPKLGSKQPKVSSEHNLTDITTFESSPVEKHPGSRNPLATVVDIQGESVVRQQKPKRFPPLEAIDAEELDAGKIYNNPVYEMEKKKREKEDAMKETVKLSLSSPLLKEEAKLKGTGHGSRSNASSKDSTGGKNGLAPTKKPVEATRSSPFSFFGGSKKKRKLRATLDSNSDNITSVDNEMHLTPPINSKQHLEKIRSSARTYNEMKCKSNVRQPSRPLSSSHSFRESSITTLSSGLASEELVCAQTSAHDSAIGLSPKYQISLSGPVPSPTSTVTSLQPTTSPYSTDDSASTLQMLLPSTNLTLPAHSSGAESPQSPMSPTKQFPPHTQSDIPSTTSKGRVKEFCQRFESISSTPPTSPTPPPISPTSYPSSPRLTSTHHCTDIDSGRESMVELVITDI